MAHGEEHVFFDAHMFEALSVVVVVGYALSKGVIDKIKEALDGKISDITVSIKETEKIKEEALTELAKYQRLKSEIDEKIQLYENQTREKLEFTKKSFEENLEARINHKEKKLKERIVATEMKMKNDLSNHISDVTVNTLYSILDDIDDKQRQTINDVSMKTLKDTISSIGYSQNN